MLIQMHYFTLQILVYFGLYSLCSNNSNRLQLHVQLGFTYFC